MTEPTISKQKLLAYLKLQMVDTTSIDTMPREMYCLGGNNKVSTLIVGITCGDFDEKPPKVPVEEALRIYGVENVS